MGLHGRRVEDGSWCQWIKGISTIDVKGEDYLGGHCGEEPNFGICRFRILVNLCLTNLNSCQVF